MAFFKSRKKGVVDLTERYHKQQEKLAELKADREEARNENSQSGGAFSFLGNLAGSGSSSADSEPSEYIDASSSEDKRKKLAKRLLDITNKLEELSNQIYHLQQRIELVEKKVGVGNY